MQLPQNLKCEANMSKVLKLKKAIYGLKQSARAWYKKAENCLIELGYKKSAYEPCLFVKCDSSDKTYIALFVDDFFVFSNCNKDLQISNEVMQDFYNFWREDYELVNREMGCVLMCMAARLDLVTEDLKMHHGNAHEFAKKHGADDTMAKQLVTIIHECEQGAASVPDECARTLEMAKCFKTRIHELKWAPSMEVVLEEVITELKN
ncbi:general odorant-binding protein 1 isoform X1 [Plutella xylostella]|uniref:general odorant-binding protein 1 isoform X1 n=1 Tax=Plutella xylostella TaxID=51655 RepID=UPI0020322748|nr:general odorant-binding protein 1 isoform X1 [Plutella xylostella]